MRTIARTIGGTRAYTRGRKSLVASMSAGGELLLVDRERPGARAAMESVRIPADCVTPLAHAFVELLGVQRLTERTLRPGVRVIRQDRRFLVEAGIDQAPVLDAESRLLAADLLSEHPFLDNPAATWPVEGWTPIAEAPGPGLGERLHARRRIVDDTAQSRADGASIGPGAPGTGTSPRVGIPPEKARGEEGFVWSPEAIRSATEAASRHEQAGPSTLADLVPIALAAAARAQPVVTVPSCSQCRGEPSQMGIAPDGGAQERVCDACDGMGVERMVPMSKARLASGDVNGL